VRDEVWEDERVASWYAQNTLLFVASDAHVPALKGHAGWGRCPARVHPTVYMTYAGGRYHALRRRVSAALDPARQWSGREPRSPGRPTGGSTRLPSLRRIHKPE
jgi:hypothetical protein